MNRLFLSVAFFAFGVCAQAQTYMLNGVEHESTIVPVTVKNFNGQTLAAAPAGKGKTLMLYRTKYSKPLDDYNSLALPELKLGQVQTRMYSNGVKLDLERVYNILPDADIYRVYGFDGEFLGTALADRENGVLRVGKNLR